MKSTPLSKKRLSSHDELAELVPDRTKAELLESLKASMEQVLAGDYRPALEVLDEIEHESTDDNADDR